MRFVCVYPKQVFDFGCNVKFLPQKPTMNTVDHEFHRTHVSALVTNCAVVVTKAELTA